MSRWTLRWNGLTLSGPHFGDRHLTIEAANERGPAWTLDIDATGGDSALMARMPRPEVVGGHLLIRSDGEHTRGASSHNQQIRCVTVDGEVAWCKPWEVEDDILAVGDAALLLQRRGVRYRLGGVREVERDEPVAIAQLVDLAGGHILEAHPILPPEALCASLRSSGWLSANLKRRGGDFVIRLNAVEVPLALEAGR